MNESKYFGLSVVVAGVVFGLALLIVALVTDGGHRSSPATAGSVAERIAPVGKLNTGAPIVPPGNAAPAAAAPAAAAGARSGEDVYKSACVACHATGAAGAPMLGNKEQWAERIAQGPEILVQHAVNGFQGKTGVMPPRGTCAACSDEELKNAVEYMVSQSR